MREVLFLLLLLATPASSTARELLYHLVAEHRSADLDYALLERLRQQERVANAQATADEPPPGGYTMLVSASDLEPLFREVVPGRHRVFTFAALEVGQPYEPSDGEGQFIAHHLLVLKTDGERKIVDGFYFVREFAEAPMLQLLLRFRSNDRRLSKGMKIGLPDFRTLGGGAPRHFDPTGRLDNLLNFKEAF